jgi:signal transduction histidine kinase
VIDSKHTQGLAMLCSSEGIIEQVLRDNIGLTTGQRLQDRPFASLIDPMDFGKALNFMVALQNQGAVFDWALNARLHSKIVTLHFAGIQHGEQVLVLAAKTNGDVMQLYDELMLMNNEQVNALRAVLKEQSQANVQRDQQLYEEISRLNNELINLQRELAQKNARLKQLNEQKNKFMGIASHDLRNPLTIILSYTGALMEYGDELPSSGRQEMLNSIYTSSEFMLGLVNDLLDFTAIEAGKLELNISPTNIVDLMERNVNLNRVLAAKKQIEIDLRVEPAVDQLPKQILVDPRKIEQVLNNLISNAMKFSFSGSVITVTLDLVDDQFVVSVADQGQGIPESEQKRLFMPFGRTSVRSTGGEHSTGLGLTIVRKIVDGHQGELSVESKPGEGATFSFSLPVREKQFRPAPELDAGDIDLSSAPINWRAAFKEAVELLDIQQAENLVAELTFSQPTTAEQLLHLVLNHRFDLLNQLVEESTMEI